MQFYSVILCEWLGISFTKSGLCHFEIVNMQWITKCLAFLYPLHVRTHYMCGAWLAPVLYWSISDLFSWYLLSIAQLKIHIHFSVICARIECTEIAICAISHSVTILLDSSLKFLGNVCYAFDFCSLTNHKSNKEYVYCAILSMRLESVASAQTNIFCLLRSNFPMHRLWMIDFV